MKSALGELRWMESPIRGPLERIGKLDQPWLTAGLSHPLLKFSGGSGDDYATIPDDSSSPS